MDLSILVVNWNTRDLLQSCLQSVCANPPACSFEVTVVDNASSDGSANMVRQFFPEVRLIENSRNVGFARANNQGICLSQASYILLLNPDTEVRSGTLETLWHFMEEHPTAGAAGARLLNGDGTLQLSCQPRPTLWREAWMCFLLEKLWPLGYYVMNRWDITVPRQVDVVKGACLIIPRSVTEQIGLLDEDYFLYAEELDYCERIRRAGYEIFWVPQAVVSHMGQQSTKQMPEASFLLLHVSKHLFFVKHYGQLAGTIFRLIVLLGALPRIVWSYLARGNRRSAARGYRQLARAIFSGEFQSADWQQSLRRPPNCEENRL